MGECAPKGHKPRPEWRSVRRPLSASEWGERGLGIYPSPLNPNPNRRGSVRAQELREGQIQAQAGREHDQAGA